MARRIEDEIDRLYQLPLNEFTPARNALAKEAGPDAGRIRRLTKPPLAAWAVNQLRWTRRDAYDALVEAAESLRKTHKAMLSGRKGDIRSADAEHDTAVDRALKETLAIVKNAGHPVTDATRQAILQTLRALPAADPPGRLSKALPPGGFELLSGIKVSVGRGRGSGLVQEGGTRKEESAAPETSRAEAARREKQEKLAAKHAREAAAAASRALREAEHEERRGEFEVARAERDVERARKRLEDARAELEAARGKAGAAKREVERLQAALPPKVR